MKLIVFILLYSILLSCSGFVKKMHNQISRGDKTGKTSRTKSRTGDPYRFYRKGKRSSKNASVTYSRYGNKKPRTKRFYKKRYNATDLEDTENNASLWSGSGKNNVLYTSDDSKKVGDLIIVQVKKSLKSEISNELKRAFPSYKPRKKKVEKKADGLGQTFKNPNTKDEPAPEDKEDTKTFDIIAGKIVDVVNDQYLLVKGRKEIIFRKGKHFIEIQGLVSRKNVYDFDKVDSSELLDAQIFIIR